MNFEMFLCVMYSRLLLQDAKELGPRTAKLALSICLKMKMIEKVLKSSNTENESLLILCLWL